MTPERYLNTLKKIKEDIEAKIEEALRNTPPEVPEESDAPDATEALTSEEHDEEDFALDNHELGDLVTEGFDEISHALDKIIYHEMHSDSPCLILVRLASDAKEALSRTAEVFDDIDLCNCED